MSGKQLTPNLDAPFQSGLIIQAQKRTKTEQKQNKNHATVQKKSSLKIKYSICCNPRSDVLFFSSLEKSGKARTDRPEKERMIAGELVFRH